MNFCGLFGNNLIWYIFIFGFNVGKVYLFGIGLIEIEICGLLFIKDGKILFLVI